MATDEVVQYLDDQGNEIKADPSVKLPKGYSLLSTKKSPDAPKKSAKDLKAVAATKKPVTPPVGYLLTQSPSLPSPDFTSNPKGEGLYEMYGRTGQGDALGQLKVPYSRVQDYLSYGGTFMGDTGAQERYAKDKAAEGKPVSWYQQILQSPKLAPVPHENPGAPIGNTERAAARTILSTPAYVKQLMDAAQSMHEGNVSGGDEVMKLLNPFEIPKQMIDQWREDAKTDPKMATDNLIGNAIGLGVVGAVTHGAMHKAGAGVEALRQKFDPVTEPPVRARTNIFHRNDAGEVRQAKGQAPTVWLSPAAWHSFMGELYPGENPAETHGLNLPADENLLEFATKHQPASPNPAFNQVQELLAKAHGNAGEGGVAIGKARPSIQKNINVMREELNHTWQRSLTGKVNDHLDPKAFADLHQSIPKGMVDHLVENGYDDQSHPEMVTEAAAKLMDGRPERFNVSPDEAVDFLDKYFKEVTAKHGAKALEELQHVRGIAADAKARAIEEHGRTRGGQDNQPVPSVAAGGQGGAEKGVPAAGEVAFNRDHDPDSQMALFREMGKKLRAARDVYSANKPETVAAYNEALRNYEFSSPSFMKRYMREQMGQMQNAGDVADVQELERMSKLGETLFNREKEKPIWYLKSERLIGEKMRGPMPGQDISKMLLAGGVKPEEMHWTGLDEFLKEKGKDKVTPQEIKDHLADNNLKLAEVTKGPGSVFKKSFATEAELRSAIDGDDALEFPGGRLRPGLSIRQDANGWNLHDANDKGESGTKYGSYVLPGGEAYREMLLTMPPKPFDAAMDKEYDDLSREHNSITNTLRGSFSPEQQERLKAINARQEEILNAQKSHDGKTFESNHWDEPNILAHVRFNDRTGPNGEKLLHVEEIQSDWHQSGRDKGYKVSDNDVKKASDDEDQAVGLMQEARGRAVAHLKQQAPDITSEQLRVILDHAPSTDEMKQIEEESPVMADYYKANAAHASAMHRATELQRLQHKGVPDAPFKKSWHEMALRRMLQHAATNGYDGVSWTPGEDQNERYDLSKQVEEIRYKKEDDGTYRLNVYLPTGGREEIGDLDEQKLSDTVGKDVAQRIISGDGEDSPGGRKRLVGDGLKVGGSGMRGFYDKIVPDYLNKFGKKYGAKVAETKVESPKDHPDREYKGPDYTVHELQEFKDKFSPDAKRIHKYLGQVLDDMANGDTFAEAMNKTNVDILAHHLGGKMVEIPNRKSVQYLPITPEMRESVGKEGVPLFNREQEKTPEFKAWFGSSKIVDEKGRPKPLYHGTQHTFDSFDLSKQGDKNSGWYGSGVYVTGNREVASEYANYGAAGNETKPGASVMPLYVKMENPYHWPENRRVARTAEEAKVLTDKLKSEGYDGVVVGKKDQPHYEVVAFSPEQVKSSIGNSGAFDPNDPSILRNREKSPDADEENKGEKETKYKFGSTQINLPEDSPAHSSILSMQEKIPESDLAGKGKDVDTPHVTVRYGLKADLTPELKNWIESQVPFEAKLGPTIAFPPSKHSDGAAPIVAPVISPELHRLNKEIEDQAEFEPSSFPEYRPHVSIAYVKPEAAEKYTGIKDAAGQSFPITSIAVSDKNGDHTEIQLKGKNPAGSGQTDLEPNTNTKGDGGQIGQSTEERGSAVPAPAPVIPVQGGTQLASAPVMIPAVPVPTKKVLPLHQIKAMAAGLNPNHSTTPQVKSVRELLKEAKSRIVP